MLSFSFFYLTQVVNKSESNIHICTETKPRYYEDVCLNLKDITSDDLDDVILGRMIKEAAVFYELAKKRLRDFIFISLVLTELILSLTALQD